MEKRQSFDIYLFSALALHYMREKNISHMDLKPQNILLASNEKHNPVLKVAGLFIFPLQNIKTLTALMWIIIILALVFIRFYKRNIYSNL